MRKNAKLGFVVTAAMAGCSVTSMARAEAAPGIGPNGVVLTPPVWPIYADNPGDVAGGTPPPTPAGSGSQRPLMQALGQTSFGQALTNARINIFGYIEGSYEYNFDHPRPFPGVPLNNAHLLDVFQHDKVYLNQVNLTIERTVDLASHQFDIGGRVEGVFGQDARFIHANGLLDHQQGSNPGATPPQPGGEYQFDLYQAYVDIGIPLGNGVRVRAGKFSFFKPINPNSSVFYTHNIAYAATFPYTNTGVTVMYPFSDTFSVEGGISRGWDQASKDNNGAIDGLVRATWSPSETSRLIASVICGPELAHDDSDYTTLADITFKQGFGENFAVFVDALYGHQVHPIFGNFPGSILPARGMTSLGAANWYGVSTDAIYSLNEYLDLAIRGEWFRDEEGYLTRGMEPGQNLYEATVGATVYPLAGTAFGRNFQIRPEVRYDYASQRFFKFDAGPAVSAPGFQKHDQVTFAVDMIVNF